jgi:hypothetical protein
MINQVDGIRLRLISLSSPKFTTMRPIFALIAIVSTLSVCTGTRDESAGSNEARAKRASSGLSLNKAPEAEASSLSSIKGPSVQRASREPGDTSSTNAPQRPADNLAIADKSEKPITTGSLTGSLGDAERPRFITYPRGIWIKGRGYSYAISCKDVKYKDLYLAKGSDDTCNGKLTDREHAGYGNYFIEPQALSRLSECTIQVTCSNGKTSDIQTVIVKRMEDSVQAKIANLPTTRVGRAIRTENFRVRADYNGIESKDFAWGLALNDCPFAPMIEPDTGEVSWVCWAKGKCTFDVALIIRGIRVDRKPLTIKCGAAAPQVESRLSRCEEVVTVTSVYSKKPFTCPKGMHLESIPDILEGEKQSGCCNTQNKRCGPSKVYPNVYDRYDEFDTVYNSSKNPFRGKEVSIIQNKNSQYHGFIGSWDAGIPYRGWYRDGKRHGEFV